MGLYALNEVRKGRITWEEWLPDGLHPTHRGSLSYGQSVMQFLEEALGGSQDASYARKDEGLPKPVDPKHWGSASLLPFGDVELEGAWTVRRSTRSVWVDQFLDTSPIGSTLRFQFDGNALVLTFDFGKTSSEFTYRIDGGECITVVRDRPDWCGDSGWLRTYAVADNLPSGQHTVEIDVVHGNRPECRGTHFALAMIGVVKFEDQSGQERPLPTGFPAWQGA